jgi:hypothetical protein
MVQMRHSGPGVGRFSADERQVDSDCSEAVIKLYPGALHTFTAFKGFKVADDAAGDTAAFLDEKSER